MKKILTKVTVFIKNEIAAYRSDRERYNEVLGIRSQYVFDIVQYIFTKRASRDRKVVVHHDGTKTVHIRLASVDLFIAYNVIPNEQKPDEVKRRLVPANEKIYVKNSLNKVVSLHTAEEYYKGFAIGGKVQKLGLNERFNPTWSAVPVDGPAAFLAKAQEDEARAMAHIIKTIAPDTTPIKVEYPVKERPKKTKGIVAYGSFTNVPTSEMPMVAHKKPRKSLTVLFDEKISRMTLMAKKVLDDFRTGIKSLSKMFRRHKKEKLPKDSIFYRMNH